MFSSAADQKIRPITLSDAFSSNRSSEITYSPNEISQMVDNLYYTLLSSKVLPKETPKPEPTLSNLRILISTICNEFLLEIDQPILKTNCSPEFIGKPLEDKKILENEESKKEHKVNEDNMKSELEIEDLLNRLLFADQDVVFTEKNCKEIAALMIDLSNNSSTNKLKNQKQMLEEKVISYGEELVKSKRLVKDRENEVKKLEKQLIHLKEDREYYVNPSYPQSLANSDTPGPSDFTD
ncbi:hypothetical protein SteCoe_3412 [Stentor coeruleus]|uniref:Uncharacterized protein n=1 Tax=Stentor coeruleus TaxID=5963 RepID=A0A1R2CX54_9CILI|nr:hypothetical protein SteCoe_3412 [Stentor coeruleus]